MPNVVDPTDPLPPKEEREGLIEALADLFRACGLDPLACAPLLKPTPKFFPDLWTPDAAGVTRLALRLLRYARLDELRVSVQLFAEHEVEPDDPHITSGSHAGAAAWFAGIEEGVVRFGANVRYLADPLGVTAAMARETAHAYRSHHGLTVDDLLAEEHLTDLTTVYLGFGLLTANATIRHSSGMLDGFASQHQWSAFGYLSPQSMCFALACHSVLRGEEARAVVSELQDNQARYYTRARAWLSAAVPDLAQRVGLPPALSWPPRWPLAQLAGPLSVGEVPPTDTEDTSAADVSAGQPQIQPVVPVRRVPSKRSVQFGMGGVALGALLSMPVFNLMTPGVGLLFCLAAGVSGAWLGRRHPRWECSGCLFDVGRKAASCSRCGGLFVKDLADPTDRPKLNPGGSAYRTPADPDDLDDPDPWPVGSLDGSDLAQVRGVIVTSDSRACVRRSAVSTVQRRLDFTAPDGYCAYVTDLGDGWDTDYVRVLMPDDLAGAQRRHGERLDLAASAVGLTLEHLVAIAETADDDIIVVRRDPAGLLKVPAGGGAPESLPGDIDEAIDALLDLPDGARRWFAPARVCLRAELRAADRLRVGEILQVIAEFGPAYAEDNTEEGDEDQHWLVIAPAVGGYVRLEQVAHKWGIEIFGDPPHRDTAVRLIAAFAGLGFQPPAAAAHTTLGN